MHPRGSAEERSRSERNLYPAPLPDAPPTERSRLLKGTATPRLRPAQMQGPCNRLRRTEVGTRTNAKALGDVNVATSLYSPSKTGGRDPRAEPVLSHLGLSIMGTELRDRTMDRLFRFMSAETGWSACTGSARHPCCIRGTPPPVSRPDTGPRRDSRCASRRDLPEGRPRTRRS